MKPMIFCAAIALSLTQAALTPTEIDAAITFGTTKKQRDFPYLQCTTSGGIFDVSYVVIATGPFSRVALAAQSAKAKYLPFTAKDVTPEMIAPTLDVSAGSTLPGVKVGHIVLLGGPKGKETAVQPLTTSTTERPHRNAVGSNIVSTDMQATFDMAAFNALPKPVSIAVVAGSSKSTCRLANNAVLR